MIIHGKALTELSQLGTESIQMCVTSPPYYGLRDYQVEGQIGLEKTPEEYIEKLVSVFREVKRVLKNDGTLWVIIGDSYLKNDGTLWVIIGDSYAGSRKGVATNPENARHYKQSTNRGMIGADAVAKVGYGNCKRKDLIGIPWMLAFALRQDGWYLRQDIIWAKPNPMPESVKDRCTSCHEYIFLLSKSKKYYYDQESIKEPCVTYDTVIRNRNKNKINKTPGQAPMGNLARNNYKKKKQKRCMACAKSIVQGRTFCDISSKANRAMHIGGIANGRYCHRSIQRQWNGRSCLRKI